MEDMIQCPDCDVRFEVIWCNDGISVPEYCPFCGNELDDILEYLADST